MTATIVLRSTDIDDAAWYAAIAASPHEDPPDEAPLTTGPLRPQPAPVDVAALSDEQVDQWFFELCGGKGGTAGPCPSGMGRQTGPGAGAKFAEATGSAAKWIRAHQADYDSDPDFRVTADLATLLAQGGTHVIAMASRVAAGDVKATETGDEKSTRWNADIMKQPYSLAGTNPMATMKTYFEGQGKNWERPYEQRVTAAKQEHELSLVAAAAVLNRTIDEAMPLPMPLFRGLHINEDASSHFDSKKGLFVSTPNPAFVAISRLKAGDTFKMPGVQSFASDKQIATDFSRSEARGQSSYQANRRNPSDRAQSAIVLEVQAGAHGLPIAPLSPWKQREVLTRGTFKVVSVTKTERTSLAGYRRAPDFHIVLRQHGH